MKRSALLLLSLCLSTLAHAAVKLPAIISDHMVLQADTAAPIWGWAEAGEEVKVAIAGQTKTTKADKEGNWSVKLDPLKTGGTHTLTVTGGNALTIQDVLVGEVWLGSGQSNMAMTVNRALDYAKEQAAANLPQLRMFTVTRNPMPVPQKDCQGTWEICTPDTVGGFSATAYFSDANCIAN